jgi:hypothetical protein
MGERFGKHAEAFFALPQCLSDLVARCDFSYESLLGRFEPRSVLADGTFQGCAPRTGACCEIMLLKGPIIPAVSVARNPIGVPVLVDRTVVSGIHRAARQSLRRIMFST